MLRYISEWQHVRRGATWIRHNKSCLVEAYEQCFGGRRRWDNVTLAEFMSCKQNLASNRQTRMLAYYNAALDLCHGEFHSHDEELLRRAKATLANMRFFALNEYQYLSQLLFERTFAGLFKFDVNLTQANMSFANAFIAGLHDNDLKEQIGKLNKLDIELYSFAVKLFFQRLNFYNIHF